MAKLSSTSIYGNLYVDGESYLNNKLSIETNGNIFSMNTSSNGNQFEFNNSTEIPFKFNQNVKIVKKILFNNDNYYIDENNKGHLKTLSIGETSNPPDGSIISLIVDKGSQFNDTIKSFDIIPQETTIFSLGSETNVWSRGYINDLYIKNTLDVTGISHFNNDINANRININSNQYINFNYIQNSEKFFPLFKIHNKENSGIFYRLQNTTDRLYDQMILSTSNDVTICENNYNINSADLCINGNGTVLIRGQNILHSGNFNEYALPITGGTISGNLTVNGNIYSNYLIGTWLQATSTTDLGSAANKIAVIRNDGWVYYRTAEETRNDINAPSKTGEGASGNWNITAANATQAVNSTNATNVNIANDTSTKLFVLGATTTGNTRIYRESSVYMQSDVLYGAAWNDYAEYRSQIKEIKPGYCVISADDGKVSLTNKRLASCDGIVSDTFGFSIGQTKQAKTPLAVAGRVLAYPDENRNNFHAGDVVCATINGKVSKMTRKEIQEYPDRIVGIVSEIPQYKTWGTGNIEVNDRIWIKVK